MRLPILLLAVLASLPLARADELLAKYDFEGVPAWLPDWGGGLGGQYKPATGWKDPFHPALDPAVSHSGAASLRIEIVREAAGEKVVHTPAIVVPPPASGAPRPLRLRLYSRGAGLPAGTASVGVLEKDEAGKSLGWLGGNPLPLPSDDAWAETVLEKAPDSRARKLVVMIRLKADQPSGTLWVDDLSVEAVDAAPSP